MSKPRKILLGFMAQFEQPILQGLKGCTIRRKRAMVPLPGDVCVGYVGLRHPDCRKVLESPLLYAIDFQIANNRLYLVELPGFPKSHFKDALKEHVRNLPPRYREEWWEELAVVDGFEDFDDMKHWHHVAGNIGEPLTIYIWKPIV